MENPPFEDVFPRIFIARLVYWRVVPWRPGGYNLLFCTVYLFVFRLSWGVRGVAVPGVALVTSILICILWIVVVHYAVVWRWYMYMYD